MRQPKAHLVVIRGRRRIGKSRLVEEAKGKHRMLSFTGIAPSEGIDAQAQRQTYANQLSRQLNLPEMIFRDWGQAFEFLHRSLLQEPLIILFDEISWMGSKGPTFLPKLKNAWDHFFSKNKNLLLVLCGSVSIWIEKNIIQSSAFFDSNVTRKIFLATGLILWGESYNKIFKSRGNKTSNRTRRCCRSSVYFM
jgi:AAA+ ATPase superfamily predicted ATPase